MSITKENIKNEIHSSIQQRIKKRNSENDLQESIILAMGVMFGGMFLFNIVSNAITRNNDKDVKKFLEYFKNTDLVKNASHDAEMILKNIKQSLKPDSIAGELGFGKKVHDRLKMELESFDRKYRNKFSDAKMIEKYYSDSSLDFHKGLAYGYEKKTKNFMLESTTSIYNTLYRSILDKIEKHYINNW
jgi:hypothetical protein